MTVSNLQTKIRTAFETVRLAGYSVPLDAEQAVADELGIAIFDNSAENASNLTSGILAPALLHSDVRIKAWWMYSYVNPDYDIRGSYNVDTITHNSTGSFTVAWDTDFASANSYTVVAMAGSTTGNSGYYAHIRSLSTSSALIYTKHSGGSGDSQTLMGIAMGDQ